MYIFSSQNNMQSIHYAKSTIRKRAHNEHDHSEKCQRKQGRNTESWF